MVSRTDIPSIVLPILMTGFVGLVSGCSLIKPAPERYGVAALRGASELLREARVETSEEGLPVARDFLVEELAGDDGSRGSLERRVIRTTRDPALVLPDSFAALSAAERRRVAIVIVPGTQTGFGGPSMTRPCLREAANRAEALGFSTHFIDTPPRGGVPENAELVAEWVEPIFKEADHVVLVMLSKGAHDVVYYLQHYALDLPPQDRAKLNMVLSLAGTLQGSVVADYFANAARFSPVCTRIFLCMRGQSADIGMLKTVARSPWQAEEAGRMGEAFPHLTWVSVAMIPDGADGEIAQRLWSPFVRGRIVNNSPYYSPADGLVESAASVLPDEVEVDEWIVRAFGSHSMPNGHYIDGTLVAPVTQRAGDEQLHPESGGEVMDAYLRALPQSLLR
ncbi:MAG: hypothetical protein KDN19_04730 [Verrucomicrobiae bacterium]|nr:hypothetical protein [Verrucomicrobiae bacterium]